VRSTGDRGWWASGYSGAVLGYPCRRRIGQSALIAIASDTELHHRPRDLVTKVSYIWAARSSPTFRLIAASGDLQRAGCRHS